MSVLTSSAFVAEAGRTANVIWLQNAVNGDSPEMRCRRSAGTFKTISPTVPPNVYSNSALALVSVLMGVPLLIAGVSFFRISFRHHRRGSEPRCSRCDYLLVGISSSRCPECGIDLATHPAVRGRKIAARGLRFTGVSFLVLGSAAMVPSVRFAANRVEWYQYAPLSFVIRDLDGQPAAANRALRELARRSTRGNISAGNRNAIVERALREPQRQSSWVTTQLNEFLGTEHASQRLSEDQKSRMYDRAIEPRLRVPPVVSGGERLDVQLEIWRSMPRSWDAMLADLVFFVDGLPQGLAEGAFFIQGGVGPESAVNKSLRSVSVGAHELAARMTLTLRDPTGKPVRLAIRAVRQRFDVSGAARASTRPDGWP